MATISRTPMTSNDHAVAGDVLSNGYWVSTVLLGTTAKSLDSMISTISIFTGPLEDRADLSTPGDYETMVFRCDEAGEVTDWQELDFRRYDTEDAAKVGHEEIVAKWMAA